MERGFVPVREEDERDCQGNSRLNSKPCRWLCHGISFPSEPQEGGRRGKHWQQDMPKVPVSNMQNCAPRVSLQWGHIVVKWPVK